MLPERADRQGVIDDSTPTRLLDATERLIGRHGVDSVSVRAINTEANSNVAAAHYHFGSKEALVRSALERRMTVLAEERFRMLEAFGLRRQPPVAAVVEVLVGPLALLAETDGGHAYVRFLAGLDRSGDPWRQMMTDAFAPQWERLEPVFARSVPGVPDDVRRLRLSVAASIMLDVLANPDRHVTTASRDLDGRGLIPAVIDIIVGVLTAPLSKGTKE